MDPNDGTPYLYYPALDGKQTHLGRAAPVNRSDPDLVLWKQSAQPVLRNIGGDSSIASAWPAEPSDGLTEYRFMNSGPGRRADVYSDGGSGMTTWQSAGPLRDNSTSALAALA